MDLDPITEPASMVESMASHPFVQAGVVYVLWNESAAGTL